VADEPERPGAGYQMFFKIDAPQSRADIIAYSERTEMSPGAPAAVPECEEAPVRPTIGSTIRNQALPVTEQPRTLHDLETPALLLEQGSSRAEPHEDA